MLELILAMLCGFAAATFGMWAFLKGQSSMLEIKAGGRPNLFELPNAAVENSEDLTKQLCSLFSETGKKSD
jgi:hypothetical protein